MPVPSAKPALPPASVVTTPAGVIFRIRLLPESATVTLPAASTAAANGLPNCAAVPVPSMKPASLPASVVTCSVESNGNRVSSAPVKLVDMERTGASFAAATATCTWAALAEAKAPSHALIVNAFRVPLAFAAGVQRSVSPVLTSVVPAATAVHALLLNFSNVPVLTASTRKLNAVPSASASFAAAASVS